MIADDPVGVHHCRRSVHHCRRLLCSIGRRLTLNNLGQTNTDVRPLNSPRATFRFPVQNTGRRRQIVRLVADAYRLPELRPCRDDPAPSADMSAEERERRVREAIGRHTTQRATLPPGWTVTIEPPELLLGPGETRDVTVQAYAPDDFVGRMGFNVNAFERTLLLGGVTLYAEGRAAE
jgi:hypothetical protein